MNRPIERRCALVIWAHPGPNLSHEVSDRAQRVRDMLAISWTDTTEQPNLSEMTVWPDHPGVVGSRGPTKETYGMMVISANGLSLQALNNAAMCNDAAGRYYQRMLHCGTGILYNKESAIFTSYEGADGCVRLVTSSFIGSQERLQPTSDFVKRSSSPLELLRYAADGPVARLFRGAVQKFPAKAIRKPATIHHALGNSLMARAQKCDSQEQPRRDVRFATMTQFGDLACHGVRGMRCDQYEERDSQRPPTEIGGLRAKTLTEFGQATSRPTEKARCKARSDGPHGRAPFVGRCNKRAGTE